jgi:hypothetical protein
MPGGIMGAQKSLFYEDTGFESSSSLALRSRPNRPLSKAERTFNRFVARVEGLRAKLQSETCRLDRALAYYGAHLHPRLKRLTELRKDMVRLCALYLTRKHLKQKRDRKTLQMFLADQLEQIIAEEGSLADDDLRALFEHVHGVDFVQSERESFEESRSVFEDIFAGVGIDFDLDDLNPDMSDAEIAAKFAAMAGQIDEKFKTEKHEMRGPGHRKSKRQLQQEELMRSAEELRKKSIASIYKQLARALHPDLEPDHESRRRKVVLMQELTSAYRDNDLHTLLRLELEWIQKEERDLDRLTDEKMRIYNEVLREQVQELEQELAELPFHPRYRPLVVMDGPFEIRLLTDGPAEQHELDRTIESMEASIARLRSEQALQEVRSFIRMY